MIFLTGATGLVGRHILAEFAARGEPVTALARTEQAAAILTRRGAIPTIGQVEDPGTWAHVGGCRAIVHSAAVIDGREGWPQYQRINVDATRRAAERALALDIPLIHISSVAVYDDSAGRQPAETVTETFPLRSGDRGYSYARSKRLAESEVERVIARGLRAIMLRPCVVYGPDDRLFLPAIARVARRGMFPLVGRGDAPLAIVHAASVATAVTAALESGEGWGRAFNVTNDDAITGAEFVAAVAEGLGRPVRAVRLPVAPTLLGVALGDLLRRTWGRRGPGFAAAAGFLRGGNPYSSAAARSVLGWQPTIRHRDAVAHAMRGV